MTRSRIGRRQLLGGAAAAAGLVTARTAAAIGPQAVSPAVVGDSGRLATHLLLGAVRVYDSRAGVNYLPDGTDPITGAADIPWVNGTMKSIDVQFVLGNAAAPTGVPATAAGVVMNITVVNIKAGGHLVAWADGDPMPPTANVNWAATTGVMNSLVMSRCADGYVSLSTRLPAGATVDLIVDVIGWLESVA